MSARQFRSRIVDLKAGDKRKLVYDGFNDPVIEPKKRQKITYHCVNYRDDKPSRMFPNYNPSSGCEPSIHACKECLQEWI
jgi:hypothetical protein